MTWIAVIINLTQAIVFIVSQKTIIISFLLHFCFTKMHQQQSEKRLRKRSLTAIVCLSLASTAAGFTTTSTISSQPHRSHHLPLHLEGTAHVPSVRFSSSLFQLNMAKVSSSKSESLKPASRPLLTPEEEGELLRQATEARRLQQLERDLALQGHLPLLSVRAKAAGYGEELEAYEDALLDGQMAREELVTRNMGLVHYAVNTILKNRNKLNSLSREDLVQEGAIGLARAVDKYNTAIGGKFSSYAIYWVRAAILRCIAERDDMLRVPSHVSQAITQINKAAKKLGVELDTASTSGAWKEAQEAKRLAEEAGLSERNFEEAMKVRNRRYTGGYVAFESWMQKGEDLTGDTPMMMMNAEDSSLSATATLQREQLQKTLAKFLRPKEMEALSWRYGLVNEEPTESFTPQQRASQYLADAEEELFGSSKNQAKEGRFGEAMSFNEVGKKMEVSAEYGRRLCHAALAKLKQAAEDGQLEPALLV